jgi:hypothetical protein
MPIHDTRRIMAIPLQRIVAFDAGHLLERGTDVALYDYALGNEEILGNRSWILCPSRADVSALDKFRARFSVFLWRDRRDLEELLRPVDLYYAIDHGARPAEPRPRPKHGKTAVHCVFECKEPHGDIYAAVSDWVADHRGDKSAPRVPVVPHMVWLPAVDGDLRERLGIPRDATVLGRHGGPSTFDIPFAHEEVARAVLAREDLWFVFLNTKPFCAPHPRIVHLPTIIDMREKARFIATCDAMLHARREGETFGLSCAEFSIRDKPVITWSLSPDRSHIETLGNKGIYYRDAEGLRRILARFRPVHGDFNAFYPRFSPENVMRQFDEVFLQPCSEPALA